MRRPSGKISPCGTVQLYSNDGEVSASNASIGECIAAVFKKHGAPRSLEAREAVGAEVRRLFESEYAVMLWAWRDSRKALYEEKQKGTCEVCGVTCNDMAKHKRWHAETGEAPRQDGRLSGIVKTDKDAKQEIRL